ncbi:hypothetical protein YC2023_039278 [Brassica napus]
MNPEQVSCLLQLMSQTLLSTFLHRRSRFSTVVSKEAMIPNFPTKLSLKFSFKSGSSVNIKIPESEGQG